MWIKPLPAPPSNPPNLARRAACGHLEKDCVTARSRRAFRSLQPLLPQLATQSQILNAVHPFHMKTLSILSLALGLAAAASPSVQAQTYVLESKIALVSTITTQGTEVTTTARNGTEVTRLKVDIKPWTNREVLAEMLARGLIGTSTSGWSLVYLSDASGAGGAYASKSGVVPVAVPADLLTLPSFAQSLHVGTETKNPNGNTYVGATEIALATATMRGLPVSGLATNGIRTATFTVQGSTYLIDTVSGVLSFTGGGTGANGVEILRGTLGIGSAKVSTLTSLP